MALEDVYKETETKMNKALEATRSDFASIRTGRAAPSLLDRLMVEAYGSQVPIKQVASVSSPDGRSLLITAFDNRVNLKACRSRMRRRFHCTNSAATRFKRSFTATITERLLFPSSELAHIRY